MRKEELWLMFEGYHDYVVIDDNRIMIEDEEEDVPEEVYERAAACELMGVMVFYLSAWED